MSHTPPTTLTTLISSTSQALDKTPEPRVPHIYALTAITPPWIPHQHCRHPRTLTLSEHTQFTEDTESAFAQTTIPTNIHTVNMIFTNIILMADKHNIPKGNMHSNYMLLLEDIVCKITQRNNKRRANTCDPALNLLNEEITFDIQKHKQNIYERSI